MINGILYSLIALGGMTVFYLISRFASNYIVGVAIGVPTAVVVSILTTIFASGFMDVRRSIANDLMRPVGFTAVLLCLAVVIIYCFKRWDKRRDIFL